MKICVSDRHGFGTDAFLLAYFSTVKPGEKVCDLGSGCGIIPMLWLRDKSPLSVCGIEIDSDAVRLMGKTAADNGVADKFFPMCADLRALPHELYGKFDAVACNPPYFKKSSGAENADATVNRARHEESCELCDVCGAAAALLKNGGRFSVCFRPERLADLFGEFRRAGIEPKRMRFAAQSEGKSPWLVLLEGKKGGGRALSVEKTLITADANEEMRLIYYGEEKDR